MSIKEVADKWGIPTLKEYKLCALQDELKELGNWVESGGFRLRQNGWKTEE